MTHIRDSGATEKCLSLTPAEIHQIAPREQLLASPFIGKLKSPARSGQCETFIWNRITAVPDHVPWGHGRYYIYWKIFYVLAGFEHALSLVAFLQSGVTFMAIFNVFSVSLFVAAFFLLKADHYQISYWSAITELVLHEVTATICIGPQFVFTNYTFLVVVLVFIQPFYSWRVSLILAILTLTGAAGVTAYSLDHPPLYAMSEEWARP